MKKEAIMHIPLSKDAFAIDESHLVIRLRTGKMDVDYCEVYYGDRVCIKEPINVTAIKMEKLAFDDYFDYFEVKIKSPYSRVCYYFKLCGMDGEIVYYSEYGFTSDMKCHRTQYFQFPYLHRNDIISIPEWTKGMVMYHIFPDSFATEKCMISCKEKTINLDDGLSCKSNNGGTIQGIVENLDYIVSLNVNCIYLNPIFKAASYHKYDTIDYFDIDPCFGTKEDLKELIKKCHKNGIKVILDGVFNHCGSGFFAFRDVKDKEENSEYKSWFYKLCFPINTHNPPNYESFAYVPEMPKLNTGNPKVQDYLCEVGKYWIREADIDGWRLDVANEINHDFWREFRKAVRNEKEDVILIGEIWEDSSIWLQGDQFDSTMNYTFSYICREYFAERKISANEFAQKINHMNLRYPEQVTLMQMNFLDTHDVPRFLSYCHGDENRLKLAVLFMMTAQGIPSIFYGDEKKIEGVTETEYRSPMPWVEDETLEKYYALLCKIRRKHTSLQTGNFKILYVNDKNNIIIFERQNEDEKLYILINNSDVDVQVQLDEVLIGVNTYKCKCPAMGGKILVGELLDEVW
jgi:glycosidase